MSFSSTCFSNNYTTTMSILKGILLIFRLLLIVMTLLLIGMPYLSPEHAGTLYFLSFITLPLLAINLVMAVLSHKVWRWVFVALCIICLPLYGKYIPSWQKQGEANDSGTFCLVSFNADNFLYRYDMMQKATAYICRLSPDIICLQERPHTSEMSWDSIRSHFAGYPYVVTNSRDDNVLNMAILSRQPISHLKEHYFEDTLNKYITVDVTVNGKKLRIFNVHLQTTGIQVTDTNIRAREVVPPMYRDDLGDEKSAYEERKEHVMDILHACVKNTTYRNVQAHEILEEVDRSPYPIVLCGDFNDTPSSYAVRTISRGLHDVSCRWPFVGTFQRMHGLMKIDYIFCSDSLECLSYQLIANPWSDHKMQVARLRLRNRN